MGEYSSVVAAIAIAVAVVVVVVVVVGGVHLLLWLMNQSIQCQRSLLFHLFGSIFY